jgi:predicted flap endonuclease-1-like 5' DNA nuclease
MRRIIGAAVLFTVIVLPRAGGLIQHGFPDSAHTVNLSDVGTTNPEPAGSPAPSQKPLARAPAAYLANPLEFLSNAPVDSLVLLPGIGPVIAQRIANARTGKRSFTRWDDLLRIKGIGPKKLDRLKRFAEPAKRL